MEVAKRFTVDDLSGLAPDWDRAVDRTPGADEFCASSIWSFSAATAFPEVSVPVLVGDGRAFCGLRSSTTADGTRMLVGLDPVWGFATPVVGPPVDAAEMLQGRLRLDDFDLAVVAGQRDDSPLTSCIVRRLQGDFRLFRGPAESRLRIDLSDGVDPWLHRRSSRFRQRIRRLRRDADAAGVEMVDLSALPSDEAFDLVLDIESRSWKGSAGTGVRSPGLAAFYRQICARLSAQERLRVLVARMDGVAVGYILGGVRGATYRGLQLSYDQSVEHLGIGHVLQFEQLTRLVGEGVAVYDLGMDMEYKRRWADRVDETFSVIVGR